MKRRRCKPISAPHIRSLFPIREICGNWESLCGSPNIRIFHNGSRFRLELIYKPNTTFTVPVCQCWGYTFFDFYGMMRITYDGERDMLLLDVEGEYKRLYE